MGELPKQKTRIVCTIGPASDSMEVLKELLEVGMNVAKLNFSHGNFDYHAAVIQRIRLASHETGIPVAIMADLPGSKLRIGEFENEPVVLKEGQKFTLTTRQVKGTQGVVSVTMAQLPGVVRRGDVLFLNDGLIQMVIDGIVDQDILCTVLAGGELRSKKGLNVPGLDLGTSAFTERDRECLAFALEHGVDAVSQSFVGKVQDVEDVRRAAHQMGFDPFVIAKIERSSVVDRMDDIVEAADGIMVARGKPVITATQMLESMTRSPRPTRAEATDVANAILDGSDAVMLSEESAMGKYPVEATRMLAKIAQATEPHLERRRFQEMILGTRVHPGSQVVDLRTSPKVPFLVKASCSESWIFLSNK